MQNRTWLIRGAIGHHSRNEAGSTIPLDCVLTVAIPFGKTRAGKGWFDGHHGRLAIARHSTIRVAPLYSPRPGNVERLNPERPALWHG